MLSAYICRSNAMKKIIRHIKGLENREPELFTRGLKMSSLRRCLLSRPGMTKQAALCSQRKTIPGGRK